MRNSIIKIAMFIVVIIIIILILLIYMLNREDNNYKESDNIVVSTTIIDISDKNVEYVKERNIYYTVINCVNRYLEYVVNSSNETIYSILDTSYIKRNGITVNNVMKYVDKLSVKTVFNAEQILEEVVDDTNANYYVSGYIQDYSDTEELTNKREFNMIVKMDYSKELFKVIPFQKVELQKGISNENK